jgi:hypothetical protein
MDAPTAGSSCQGADSAARFARLAEATVAAMVRELARPSTGRIRTYRQKAGETR